MALSEQINTIGLNNLVIWNEDPTNCYWAKINNLKLEYGPGPFRVFGLIIRNENLYVMVDDGVSKISQEELELCLLKVIK